MHVPDPRIGTVLHDRYRVLERMSEGSMGVVYRGERVKLGRPVAIKWLSEGYAATTDGVRRFEVEARAMSRLAHPNCVGVTDFGLDQGAPYLVMDYISGRNLRQVLAAERPLPAARAIDIVRQVLAGLAHAHGQHIIHRDIKPENILVTPAEGHSEHVRIVDFGLAKLRDEASVTTGVAVGTPGYMSPEQTVGDRVDERADIYGVGIILYELLTGEKPFQSSSPFEVMRMHREVTAPPLEAAAPDRSYSRALDDVVHKALAKLREHRFPTAVAFQAALSRVPEATGGGGSRGLWRIAVVAGLALTAAGVTFWWQRGRTDEAAPRPAATATMPAATGTPAQREEGAAAPSAALPVEPPGAATAPGAVPAGELDSAKAGDAAVAAAPAGTPDGGSPRGGEVAAGSTELARLQAQAASGDLGGAARGLEALRRRAPTQAAVPYALGNVYAEMQSWVAAVDAYAVALSLDPSYRTDPRLIGDLVEALASTKAHPAAAKVIRTQVGAAALQRVEQATRSAAPKVRLRAKRLRAQLLHP